MKIILKNLMEFNEDFKQQTRNWRNSLEVSENFIIPYITKEMHNKWLDLLKEGEQAVAFVIIKSKKLDSDSLKIAEIPIGLTYFKKISKEQKGCDWGIYIHDINARGKGIGSQVLDKSIYYAFNVLKLEKINLEVLDINDIAKNLYIKKGFVFRKDNKEENLVTSEKKTQVLQMYLTKENFYAK